MHEDAGHYAAKHPKGAALNEKAAAAIKARVKNERLSCKAAHEAAAEAGVSPAEIGRTLDLLEVRINGCQLGLFGHNNKDHGKAELKEPANADKVREAVKAAAVDGGVGCLDLWKIAEEYGCSRPEAAAVCDGLDLKIGNCQLGTF